MGKTNQGVSRKELFHKGAVTRPARQFMADIAALKASMKEAQDRGADPKYINTLAADGRAAILKDLRTAQETERQRLRTELEKEKVRYNREYMKDLTAHVFELDTWERKCRAMSTEELKAFTVSYIAGTANVDDSHELDILSAEMHTRGLAQDHAILRKKMAERRADHPEERTEIGAALVRELKLNEPVSGGGILLDFDGRTGAAGFDQIAEALDE